MVRAKHLAIAGGLGLGTYLLIRPRGLDAALTKPLARSIVGSGWGATRGDTIHRSIDLGGPVGEPVHAIAAGRVIRADRVDDSKAGRWVGLEHELPGLGRVISRYLHLDVVGVELGQRVGRGQIIGTLGVSGTSGAWPHLHLDLLACGAALAAYRRMFPTAPTGGRQWFAGCTPVAAEPLVPVDGYEPGVLAAARASGIPVRIT